MKTGHLHRRAAKSIEQSAADWLVRRREGLKSDELKAFEEWIFADARHAQAFAELERAWEMLNRPRAAGRSAELAARLKKRKARSPSRLRAIYVMALGVAATVAVGLFLNFSRTRSLTMAAVSTVQVKPCKQVLDDGSVVELNAGAEISIDFTAAKRGVHLLRGDALFHVAKSPHRPFVVSVNGVDVTAVGTAFFVRSTFEEVGVLVTEGRVAVAKAPAETNFVAPLNSPAPIAEPLYVSAGERTIMPVAMVAEAPKAEKASSEEIDRALAWRGHRIEFMGTPLAEAVELFNRQNKTQILLGNPAVGQLKLSGVFWSDDPEGFARLLETCMSLRAAHTGGQITLTGQ